MSDFSAGWWHFWAGFVVSPTFALGFMTAFLVFDILRTLLTAATRLLWSKIKKKEQP